MISVRRLTAAALAALLVLLPIASFLVDTRLANGRFRTAGYVLFGLGAFVSASNFFLSFGRPLLHALRRAPDDEYRFVSGAPMIGSVTLIGLALAPPSTLLSGAALLFVLADTGNWLWFVVCAWRSESLWQGDGGTP